MSEKHSHSFKPFQHFFGIQVRSPSCVSDTPPGCRLTCCEGRNNIYARSHPGLSYKGDLVLCVGNKPPPAQPLDMHPRNNHLDADRRSSTATTRCWHYEVLKLIDDAAIEADHH